MDLDESKNETMVRATCLVNFELYLCPETLARHLAMQASGFVYTLLFAELVGLVEA